MFIDGIRQDLRFAIDKQAKGKFLYSMTQIGKSLKKYETQPFISKVVTNDDIKANQFSFDVVRYTDDSKAANYLRELKKTYPSYQYYRFDDEQVVLDIEKVRSMADVEEGKNTIYMPNIANMKAVVNLKSYLEGRKTKPDRYWKVKLNPELVEASYVEYFFRSDLGRALYASLGQGVTIPHVNLEGLKGCTMAFPELGVQKAILSTVDKIDRLTALTDGFKDEISLNPGSAESLSTKLDEMLEAIEQLSEEDQVLSLIRSGESKTVEFKETFEHNDRISGGKSQRDPKLIAECIETMAGFMNTDGGDLLVGVHDKGDVIGIERDLRSHKNSYDTFLVHIANFIRDKIGKQFFPLLDQRIIIVSGKPVLRVTCLPSDKRVFVDGKDFFLRTNPATVKLEGEELIQYLESDRFKKSD